MAKKRKSQKQQQIERELKRLAARRKSLKKELRSEKRTSKKIVRKASKRVKTPAKKANKNTRRINRQTRKTIHAARGKKRTFIKIRSRKLKRKIITKKRVVKRAKRTLTVHHRRRLQVGLRRYYSLLEVFKVKQDRIRKRRGKKPLKKIQYAKSRAFKNMLRDLEEGNRLKANGQLKKGNKLMRNALKMTTLRDGIPDSVPVGETAKQGGENE